MRYECTESQLTSLVIAARYDITKHNVNYMS